jgi:hypothetical protein
MRRLIYSIFGGIAFAFLPRMTTNWPESAILGPIKFTFGLLTIPGSVMAMIVAGGKVHSVSQRLIDTGDLIFFSAVVYWFLTIQSRKDE